MSAWFAGSNLKGFSHWMNKQAGEEYAHAMKFYKYIIDRGGKVVLKAIAAPPVEWKSALAIFEQSYGHEQEVTKRIYNVIKEARAEDDPPTLEMLQWFVKEQVEEESSALEIVEQLKMIGDSKGSLFMLDHRLAKRE